MLDVIFDELDKHEDMNTNISSLAKSLLKNYIIDGTYTYNKQESIDLIKKYWNDIADMYYDYMTARQLYDMTTEMVEQRRQNYQNSQKSKKEVILITDTFYREAMDEQIKARGSFFEKRSRLEQLVGNDVFRQFEAIVDARYTK